LNFASMLAFGCAPMIWSTTFPPLKKSSIGIERTLKRAAD
jgi:hypothetical protein